MKLPAAYSRRILKLGVNPYVSVPAAVIKMLAAKRPGRGPIPVRGSLNGAPFRQTLVKYAGAWRLYLNGPMLKAAHLAVGDRAEVTLDHDPEPRTVPMVREFARALAAAPAAKAVFKALPPSRQKEILRYLANLRTPEARNRNVARMIAALPGTPWRR